jgi:hypothetical protein
MAVGLPLKTTYANGDVYSASDVNDTNGTINTTASPYAAGKNKIINGNMNIWQRGTSFAPSAAGFYYTADRWVTYNFATSATTVSQQAFTAGAAPATPYESQYFLRISSTNTQAYIEQRIEDVRTFANSTVTLSFWAKSASAQTLSGFKIYQAFGSGGSANVDINGTAPTLTTSWVRYTATFSIPSISGKTIGAGSSLTVAFGGVINNALDIWGVQLEAGSTATPFQTATGTIQGELAACQRYYYNHVTGVNQAIGLGAQEQAGLLVSNIKFPVEMRVAPSLVAVTGTNYYAFDRNSTQDFFNSFTIITAAPSNAHIFNNTEISGTVGFCGRVSTWSTSSTASVAFNSEL